MEIDTTAEPATLQTMKGTVESQQAAVDAGSTPGSERSRRIMCVDDDSQRLSILRILLERAGYYVVTTQSGAAALDHLRQQDIDLVVVDQYMPGMSGEAVAVELKRINTRIPVVIFSSSFALPERAVALVDGFVAASDFHVLREKISELLGISDRASDKSDVLAAALSLHLAMMQIPLP